MKRTRTLISLAILAALMLIVVLVPLAFSQGVVTNFGSLHVSDGLGTATPVFQVNNTGSSVIAEFQDSGTPVAQFPDGGGLTINSGGLTVTSGGANVVGGALIAGGGIRLSVQTAAITDGYSITPAASYINITSTIEVTSSTTVGLVTTTATIGDLVVLRNGNASDAVHVDGTGGTIECKANVDLAAADTLTLLFTGSVWNCLSSYDNS